MSRSTSASSSSPAPGSKAPAERGSARTGGRAGPFGRVHARIVAFGRSLLAAHASPRSLALAVFVGAVAGCTPFFGFHLPLCVALAWLLRLNQPAVYAAANISVPPLVPLLGFASCEIGERLLHGRWLPLGLDDFRRPEGGIAALAGRFLVDWLAGGMFVGAAIGAVLAAGVFVVAQRRAGSSRAAATMPGVGPPETAPGPAVAAAGPPETAPASTSAAATPAQIAAAITEASRCYRGAPRSLRWYAFFKYRMDPCYRRIAALVPPGSLTVDLGAGLGMLPLVLALLPGGRRAVGVEWDESKHAAGERAAARVAERVRLVRDDARTFAMPRCDVVTLVDVLHYFDAAVQRDLLARAAAALAPGGRLLVREGDAGRRGGARWTRALEAVTVRLGWNRGGRATRFRRVEDLAADLRALGLIVSVEPLAGRLHPGNVLFRAERPAAASATEDGPPTPYPPENAKRGIG